MSLKCYDCELEYNSDAWVETHIPDEIWKIISPNNDESGILCINCISRRLIQNNIKECPVWLCGTSPLIAKEGDYNDVCCKNCNKLELKKGFDLISDCDSCLTKCDLEIKKLCDPVILHKRNKSKDRWYCEKFDLVIEGKIPKKLKKCIDE